MIRTDEVSPNLHRPLAKRLGGRARKESYPNGKENWNHRLRDFPQETNIYHIEGKVNIDDLRPTKILRLRGHGGEFTRIG